MRKQQTGAVKYLLIFAGLVLVAIGIIGILLPGLPTTIFLIAAAVCFAKSSPRLHNWLLSHRWFGPIIHNWHETRSIPRNAKRVALLMMGLACIYTAIVLDSWFVIALVFAVMILPAVFVYRLPLSEEVAVQNDGQKSAKIEIETSN